MKKNEALLLSAFTGFLLVKYFHEVHEYIEEILGRQVFTHELANKKIHKEIQEKSKKEFIKIIDNIKG